MMISFEDDYKIFLQNLNIGRLRVVLTSAIIFVPIFSVIDYFIYPEYVGMFLPMRVICLSLLALIFALSFTEIGNSYCMGLQIFTLSNIAIMIAVTMRYLGDDTPYYAGFNLIILAIGIILPWDVWKTLIGSGVIYSSYLVPILLLEKIGNTLFFVNNNIYLLGTIMVVCVGSYFTSSLRRREFIARSQLEQARMEIEQSYQKLQEMNHLKSRFFANISHELRTPLTFIMGPTEMLLNREFGKITHKQEEYLLMIQTHSTRLLRLINHLLNLSKVDAERTRLSLKRGNLIEFIRQIIHSIMIVAEQKSIKVTFSAHEPIPEFLYDPDKMEDILLNLLSNALKFTEKGRIRVSCTRSGSNVVVKISDTGIGIPKGSIPMLFDRFFQVDNEKSRASTGTGIGLALVKEWVELHRGRVWALSEEGKGSTFVFTIPILIEEVVEKIAVVENRTKTISSAQLGLPSDEESIDWQNVSVRNGAEKILIVDDNSDMLRYMADQLKNDYNLFFAKNGEEGVAISKLAQPDLILSDIMMPVKDGYQMCRELKGDTQTSHIPLIFLTAKGDISDKIEGFEQGGDDYLTKPFNKEELKVRVRSLLKIKKLQKEVITKNQQLEEALKEVKRVGYDLIHAEKMAALGVVMAGIAHEINNPVSFAKGSLSVVRNAVDGMKRGEMKGIQEVEMSLDIIDTGLERAAAIVQSLSSFVRKDDQWTEVNIQASLETTLRLLYHEIKQRIEICRDYTELPLIEASPGQINQALMNIFLNAIQAIPGTGRIWVTTRAQEKEVTIVIRDNGVGIHEKSIDKIFDPFFTTKEIGKGTGLGMAITRKIIVENHRGTIDVKSKIGWGTEMMITLPLSQFGHNAHHGDISA